MIKRCRKCLEYKDISSFYQKSQGYICRSCSGKASGLWLREHKGRVNIGKRILWSKNKNENNLRRRARKLGVSVDHIVELVSIGSCDICSKYVGQKGHVDHDHRTGNIRGYLCNACNRGLGYLGDNEFILLSAVKYLTR